MTIPYRDRGYAIDIPALVVHERYAPHAVGLPRVTHRGMLNIVGVQDPRPCPLCFPVAPEPVVAQPSRRRRLVVDDEAVVEVAEAETQAEPSVLEVSDRPAPETAEGL